MPFSLRELNWMLEAKTQCIASRLGIGLGWALSSYGQSNGAAKAMHTGRRVSPEEFIEAPLVE